MAKLRQFLKTVGGWIVAGITVVTSIFILFRRKDISDGRGVQQNTGSTDTIRDGITTVKSLTEASSTIVESGAEHISTSLEHTNNAIDAVRDAKSILAEARRRATEENK